MARSGKMVNATSQISIGFLGLVAQPFTKIEIIPLAIPKQPSS